MSIYINHRHRHRCHHSKWLLKKEYRCRKIEQTPYTQKSTYTFTQDLVTYILKYFLIYIGLCRKVQYITCMKSIIKAKKCTQYKWALIYVEREKGQKPHSLVKLMYDYIFIYIYILLCIILCIDTTGCIEKMIIYIYIDKTRTTSHFPTV